MVHISTLRLNEEKVMYVYVSECAFVCIHTHTHNLYMYAVWNMYVFIYSSTQTFMGLSIPTVHLSMKGPIHCFISHVMCHQIMGGGVPSFREVWLSFIYQSPEVRECPTGWFMGIM